jgi:hypothetical protein
MTRKISPHEWEALSAYLDEEMNTPQRDKLEHNLSQDTDLRSALEGLRRTRQALRSQPKFHSPRNFTLTPQMAGARYVPLHATSPYPVLRLASVLAAVFFGVLIAGDLLTLNLRPAMLPQAESAVQAIPPGMGGGGGGGGVGSGPAEPAQVITETILEATVEVSVAMEAPVPTASAPPASEAGEAVMKAAPSNEVDVTPLPLPTEVAISPTEAPVTAAEPMLSAQDTTAAESEIARQSEAEIPQQTVWGGRLVLRLVEVLLVFLALGAGVAALLFRRTSI